MALSPKGERHLFQMMTYTTIYPIKQCTFFLTTSNLLAYIHIKKLACEGAESINVIDYPRLWKSHKASLCDVERTAKKRKEDAFTNRNAYKDCPHPPLHGLQLEPPRTPWCWSDTHKRRQGKLEGWNRDNWMNTYPTLLIAAQQKKKKLNRENYEEN